MRDDPEVVADLALEADEHQFLKIYPLLERQRSRMVPKLQAEACAPAERQSAADEESMPPAAGGLAAIGLLRLGEGRQCVGDFPE